MIVSLALAASIAVTPGGSAEYRRGWCDAAKAVWANRNHNRMLLGYAPETQEEAMKRIYKSWPAPSAPKLPKAPDLAAIGKTLDIEADATDLYVVLPQCNENKR